MKMNAISIIEIALEGESEISQVSKKLGMKLWDVHRLLGYLRKQQIISSQVESIRLRNDERVELLKELAKEVNVKKILHESNEIVLSYLIEPISLDDLIIQTKLSRATIYRAKKDFEESGILKKTISEITFLTM